jgi:hypothetical protein
MEVVMVSLMSLWLPILLSAVLVFVISSLIHMVLPYHKNDFRALPAEDEVMDALRRTDLPPGDYALPYASSMEEMKSPEYTQKRERGPVAFMTVMKPGQVSMGPQLAQWFAFSIVIGIFAGYIAGRALSPGAEYADVFRFVGAAAFGAYSFALWQYSIWFHRSWSTTLKFSFDGLIYAVITAGVFGWLWP